MGKQLLFFILSILCTGLLAQQYSNVPPVGIQRPTDFEYLSAPDSNGIRHNLKMPAAIGENKRSQQPQLPYPIIFIHGLASNSETRDTMSNWVNMQYNLAYGGRFDFCLNYNGDYAAPNLTFAHSAGQLDADLAFFTPTLTAGDYYYVNYDVGTDGSFSPSYGTIPYVESNQAAIYKQGLALKWAIYNVLQVTGKDKVILMGHSMGGLAARQYLQNPSIWQPDGQHHVAKLVTTGTPHGGSNASIGSFLDDVIANIDDQSEAVRDLRTYYYYSDDPGVYLFGGYESNAVMNDMLLDNFYNVYVNCDDTMTENIVGVNSKDIYTDLAYSCIIGECTSCPLGEDLPGDGVVNDTSANLKTYYSGLNVNLFYYYGSAADDVQIHTILPDQIIQDMEGLDEPDSYNLAYYIGFDTTYLGFTTTQDPNDGNYPRDFDEYTFTVPVTSNVTVNIGNISLSNLHSNIVDIINDTVYIIDSTFNSNGSSVISFTEKLNAGNYFLEIFGTPDQANSTYPYTFTLSRTDISGVRELSEISTNTNIYPNPASSELIINTHDLKPLSVSIYDMNGRKIIEENYEHRINITLLNPGMYFIELNSEDQIFRSKFIKL